MDISNIYEFFSIIDFISSIYENMEKEVAPVLLALHNAKRRGFASLFIHPTIIKR